ncbi:hypothetical protein THRCLA_08621 [Thraustotheca clavata]|uniref:FYVE-type domain-containing protein n=1 Tax=Thraustotheca clavata TaxID=74557 RepID=A0A1V9Z4G1_9STRA|nr:hypothetical protein THRCLA_08621 [Thraustotheca clavata]
MDSQKLDILNYYLDACTKQQRRREDWKLIKTKGDLQVFRKCKHKKHFSNGAKTDPLTNLHNTPINFVLHGINNVEGCTLHEIQNVLCARLTVDFRAMMKLLHGNDFLDGAILSVFDTGLTQKRDRFKNDPITNTLQWFALKSSSVLAKNEQFCMQSYSQIVNTPIAPTKTFVWTLHPVSPTNAYRDVKVKRSTWELGLVAEEISTTSLRISVRCQSKDNHLHPSALRFVTNMLTRLQDAIQTLQAAKCKNLVSQDQWIKDDERSECAQCTTEFTTFRRRHHCRVCGEVICSSCSAHHSVNEGSTKIRICRKCLLCQSYDNKPEGNQKRGRTSRLSQSWYSTARSSSVESMETAEYYAFLRNGDSTKSFTTSRPCECSAISEI